MRTVKKVLTLAKQHHHFWNEYGYSKYMCFVLESLYNDGFITLEEYRTTSAVVMQLVKSIDPISISLAGALDTDDRDVIRNYWETFINSLED